MRISLSSLSRLTIQGETDGKCLVVRADEMWQRVVLLARVSGQGRVVK